MSRSEMARPALDDPYRKGKTWWFSGRGHPEQNVLRQTKRRIRRVGGCGYVSCQRAFGAVSRWLKRIFGNSLCSAVLSVLTSPKTTRRHEPRVLTEDTKSEEEEG